MFQCPAVQVHYKWQQVIGHLHSGDSSEPGVTHDSWRVRKMMHAHARMNGCTDECVYVCFYVVIMVWDEQETLFLFINDGLIWSSSGEHYNDGVNFGIKSVTAGSCFLNKGDYT